MTNTNATYATSIAVDLPDYPAATVTFTNTAFFVSGNSEVLPGKQYTLTLNSTGQGTQTLPCPDNTGDAAVNWRINLPSKESGTYAIAYDAATQQLSDILAAQSTTADPDAITAAIAGKMDRDTDGTAGNLTVLDASGNAVDAGYAADVNATAGSVVRRDAGGTIANALTGSPETSWIYPPGVFGGADSSEGVYGITQSGVGVNGVSVTGTGGQSTSTSGTYHHRFGIKSAIERTTGVLKFVDSTAATDRAAQRTELGLGTAALAATGDFDAAGAAATAQAAAVQRANHTGTQLLATISDAGTMAAAATTSYYAKTDFSAAPAAAEPLKADGSGGMSPKTIDLRGATVADFTALFPGKAATAYGIQTQSSGATGGLSANGFTNATATALPMIFTAYHGSTSPTVPAIIFRGAKHNGTTSAAALAFAEQLIQFRNWTTNVMTILGGGEVGIRTDTPSAQLHLVANAASKIGEIIQLAASPTANALEVRSSVGAVLAKIEPDGEVQAAGYRSSDGTAGWTGTFTNGDGATVTVKNGLITGVA